MTDFTKTRGDRGISPLVGGILMAALVILMAALAFFYLSGILDENTPELAAVTWTENPEEGTVTVELVSLQQPQTTDRVLLVHGDTLETLATLDTVGETTDVVPPADARILVIAVDDEDPQPRTVTQEYDPEFGGTEVGFTQDDNDNVDVTLSACSNSADNVSVEWEADGSTQERTLDCNEDTTTIPDSEISNGTNITATEQPSGTVVEEYTYTTDSSTAQSFSTAPNCAEDVTYTDKDNDGYWGVDNVYELQCINEFGLEKNYELTQDIDASETSKWNDDKGFVPLGAYSFYSVGEPFTGEFEGRGYAVNQLYIDRPGRLGVGLFGNTDSASINEVTLRDASVTGNFYTGGLVGGSGGGLGGGSDGNITNSHVTGDVEGKRVVGGLAGIADNVDNSSSEATVTSSSDIAGGLVGNGNNITNSTASGDVTSTGGGVGGLAGIADNVDNSAASGNVTADGSGVGGLVGTDGYNINNSSASGDVEGANRVGGLVGKGDIVDNSTATGDVTGGDEVGGLAGYTGGNTDEEGDIENSSASGDVEGTKRVGGLVGRGDDIGNSSASGDVTGGNEVGGLVGKGYGIYDSHATGYVTGGDSVGGLVGVGGAEDSYATGDVTGVNQTGGLVGSGGDITNSNASGDVIGSGDDTGGLVGLIYDSGGVEGSSATGNVTGGGDNTGGLVGYIEGETYDDGEITNSSASGDVKGDGDYVGGLVGSTNADIESSRATVDVEGTNQVGGITGACNQRCSIINTSASGDVTAGGDNVGGLAGYFDGSGADTGEIKNSHATGYIKGDTGVGGLVGFITRDGDVTRSSASGDVEGNRHVGGLIGNSVDEYSYSNVDNSYSTSNITGDEYVGGILGYETKDGFELENSYHAGSLEGNNNTGGIAPADGDGEITDSYWDEDKSNADPGAGGTPLSTAEMQGSSAEDNMNLDFNNTWETTDDYPELQAEG